MSFLLFFYLLHVHLLLMTLKAYILTQLFTKGTEAEVASLWVYDSEPALSWEQEGKEVLI